MVTLRIPQTHYEELHESLDQLRTENLALHNNNVGLEEIINAKNETIVLQNNVIERLRAQLAARDQVLEAHRRFT